MGNGKKRSRESQLARDLSDSFFRDIMDQPPLFLLERPSTVHWAGKEIPLPPAAFKILIDAVEVLADESRPDKHVLTKRRHWIDLYKAIPAVKREGVLRDYLSGQRLDDRNEHPDLRTQNDLILAVGPLFSAKFTD